MSYRPFLLMTGSARRTELWRLSIGLCLIVLVAFALPQGIFAVVAALVPPETTRSFLTGLQLGDTPTTLLVLLFAMGTLGIGTIAATQLIHQRRARSLFGPMPMAVRQFGRVFFAVALLYLVIALLPPWDMARDLQPGLPSGQWLALLPLTLAALLIQTGSEELLFRGYLQSQLAARLPHPSVWLIAPSALFALGHWTPATYGGNAWLVMSWAFVFGLAAADLTARAGTLGPAIALHMVNNLVAIALISPQGTMSGLALYQLPFGAGDEEAIRALLPFDLASIGLSWLAARIALRA
ncbi:CPBP family intramembrane glutamic endopeptidase [Salipiger sp.]|uniref:CPBP family intramembrane glutamic endopeptidase n=1 Tax=Salipiger sp. TaxID=2078585 RepID=UPI003A97E499